MNVKGEFGNYFLDDILEWISENIPPDDVFNTEELENWATEYYGFDPNDVSNELDEMKEYVKELEGEV